MLATTVYNMRPTGPKLDKHGFPIPPDFDAAGVDDPGRGPSNAGPWLRRLLKLAVVGVVAAALWIHFDVGSHLGGAVAQYHAQQAAEAFDRGDLDGALAQADRALAWQPDSVQFLWMRGFIRARRQEFEPALADCETAVAIKPNDEKVQRLRLSCLHHLQRQRDVAAVATDVLQRNIGNRAELLNTRAYARSLGDFELDEALVDIQEVLGGSPDNASFLDTRGYVLFKLARLKEALADLNRAIELTEQERDQFEQALQGRRLSRSDVAAKAEQERQFDENLAVMHHHRGEVHEKLGHADEAKKDLFIAQELGFNPAAGVY